MKLFDFLKKDKGSKGRKRTWAVIDVNDKDFRQQVVRRSYKTMVMVDFWAAWCAPCRQLGPVLEDMAIAPESGFILAKLDTENNQQIAKKFQIQSIPAVKMFRNGQVVGEFIGARPAGLVKHFVSKTMDKEPPAPRISGSSQPAQRLKQAKQHLRKGRGFEAFVLLDNFPPGEEEESVDRLLSLARFLFDMDDGDGLTGLEELDKQYIIAARSIKQRKYDRALGALNNALDLGEEMDEAYTLRIIGGISELTADGVQ